MNLGIYLCQPVFILFVFPKFGFPEMFQIKFLIYRALSFSDRIGKFQLIPLKPALMVVDLRFMFMTVYNAGINYLPILGVKRYEIMKNRGFFQGVCIDRIVI